MVEVSPQTKAESPLEVPDTLKKRKREDEAVPSNEEIRKRAHNTSIRTDRVSNTMTIESHGFLLPRFTPASPVASGSQGVLTFGATATDKPFEAYVLPPRSFQQYALDLSEVFQERAYVLAMRLARIRAELAETKSQAVVSMPEHQAESCTQKAEMEGEFDLFYSICGRYQLILFWLAEEPSSKKTRAILRREKQNFDEEWRAKYRMIEQYANEAHLKTARIDSEFMFGT